MKFCFIRHAPSISNEMRDRGEEGSQDVRDPALSANGLKLAKSYGPTLRKTLATLGFNIDTARLASSELKRAKQTASALFPGKHSMILSFGENGAIPENTPEGHPYHKPDLKKFLDHMRILECDMIIVGHGSFLTNTVWPYFAGTKRSKMKNLDAFVVDSSVRKIPGPIQMSLIRTKSRRRNRRSKSRSRRARRTQRGGGLPLGMFVPGAQMSGTTAFASNAPQDNNWIRAPLNSTFGNR